MKVFISWSGKPSKYIAETLSNWLEQVLQVAEPWISADIEKGKRWSIEISDKLKESKMAIICLTKDNLDSKWIHFEAGAIAKTDDAQVCTFLYNLNPTDVQQPLSQFQNTKNEKEDILKLVKTINSRIGNYGGKPLKEINLESVFETFYPQLEEKLKLTPEASETVNERTEKDMIEESLQILRNLKNNINAGFLSENDQNEIIDFWIEKFAKNNKIDYDMLSLNGKEDECVKYMTQIPEIRKFFGTGDLLKNRIKNRINKLPPF